VVLPCWSRDIVGVLHAYLYPGTVSRKLKNLYALASHDKIPSVEDLSSSVTLNRFSIRKIYVLLPAYNEVVALTQLIPNIVHHLKNTQIPFEIIIVNDGSTDRTSSFLSTLSPEMAIRELKHEQNQGYGAALKTGFCWIAKNAPSNSAVVTMDADNTQDPCYITSLLAKLEQGADAVTASYTMPGGDASGLPVLRRILSGGINRIFQWVIGIPYVGTYTNGFRAYRVSAIQKAQQLYTDQIILDSGFPGGTEFFLKVVGSGGKAVEIPFVLHYEQRGQGSKIRLLATVWRYIKLVAKGRFYVHP
jgi:dolichol-phosphate mannosyltransferase